MSIYCINISKRIMNIQFKESFRPMFLYINRLEDQVHAYRQKGTSVCIYILWFYIYKNSHRACGYVAIICTQTHNGYSMQA